MARISPGTMTAAIFAILVGLAGAFMVRQRLQQPAPNVVADGQIEELPPTKRVWVPVAADSLDVGRRLTLNDIVIREFSPEEFRASEFFGKGFMPETDQMDGRVLKVALAKGESFDPSDFFADGMGPGVAGLLKPGMRAVTVPIENVGAVEGFARPGSVVDVLFRSEKTTDRAEMTVTLLELVEVLAIDKITESGRDITLSNQATVTLAVAPRQAKALKTVEGRGQLSLTLRNPDDLLSNEDIVQLGFQNVSDSEATEFTEADAGPVDAELVQVTFDEVSDHKDRDNEITEAQERLTVDDLLGVPAKKRITSMVIYRGGSRSVQDFGSSAPEVEVGPVPGLNTTPVAAESPQPKFLQTTRVIESSNDDS